MSLTYKIELDQYALKTAPTGTYDQGMLASAQLAAFIPRVAGLLLDWGGYEAKCDYRGINTDKPLEPKIQDRMKEFSKAGFRIPIIINKI